MKRGAFIVIDGPDGAGKTSLCKLLSEELPPNDFLITREPGGTPFAEKIRDLFLTKEATEADVSTMLLLAFASRYDHLFKKIIPALESGKNVIVDRFDSSSFAFQVCAQEGQHLKELFFDLQKIYENYRPDKYIFLDVDSKESVRRSRTNSDLGNHFDRRDENFREKTKNGYRLFGENFSDKVLWVDANRAQKDVKNEVLGIINKITNG